MDNCADVLIPKWVIDAISPLNVHELQDITEINLGMYGPGYQRAVVFPPSIEPRVQKPMIKKVSLKRTSTTTYAGPARIRITEEPILSKLIA